MDIEICVLVVFLINAKYLNVYINYNNYSIYVLTISIFTQK